MRHNDWDVAKRHAEIIAEIGPQNMRTPQLHTNIPGFDRGRITSELRAGLWMQPLGSDDKDTYSSVQDIERMTLLIAAVGMSTRGSKDVPALMGLNELIRTRFASRRVMKMTGELYSYSKPAQYTIDESVVRKYDVIQVVLVSRFREDR